jgi:hypothetical protein
VKLWGKFEIEAGKFKKGKRKARLFILR